MKHRPKLRRIPAELPIEWTNNPDSVLVLPVNKDNEIFADMPIPDLDGSGISRGTAVQVASGIMQPIDSYTLMHSIDENGKHRPLATPRPAYFKRPVFDADGNHLYENGEPKYEPAEVWYNGPRNVQELHRDFDADLIEQLENCPYNGDHPLCHEGNPYGYEPLFVLFDPKRVVQASNEKMEERVRLYGIINRMMEQAQNSDIELLGSMFGVSAATTNGSHDHVRVLIFEAMHEDPYRANEILGQIREDLRLEKLFKLGVWRKRFGVDSGFISHVMSEGYEVVAEDGTGETTTYKLPAGSEKEGILKLGNTQIAYEALVRQTGFDVAWNRMSSIIQNKDQESIKRGKKSA